MEYYSKTSTTMSSDGAFTLEFGGDFNVGNPMSNSKIKDILHDVAEVDCKQINSADFGLI
ncbi:MAG: hypothetical protein HOG45_06185 [Deltaproteobacteria bacterium]|nr:hypothetical protein [Deltaproteobacteria bacterium]